MSISSRSISVTTAKIQYSHQLYVTNITVGVSGSNRSRFCALKLRTTECYDNVNHKNPFYRRLYLSPDKHLVKYIFGQIIFRIIRINVYQNSNFWFSHFSEFEPNNFKQFKISDGLKNGSQNNYQKNQNFSNCKVIAILKNEGMRL